MLSTMPTSLNWHMTSRDRLRNQILNHDVLRSVPRNGPIDIQLLLKGWVEDRVEHVSPISFAVFDRDKRGRACISF